MPPPFHKTVRMRFGNATNVDASHCQAHCHELHRLTTSVAAAHWRSYRAGMPFLGKGVLSLGGLHKHGLFKNPAALLQGVELRHADKHHGLVRLRLRDLPRATVGRG